MIQDYTYLRSDISSVVIESTDEDTGKQLTLTFYPDGTYTGSEFASGHFFQWKIDDKGLMMFNTYNGNPSWIHWSRYNDQNIGAKQLAEILIAWMLENSILLNNTDSI